MAWACPADHIRIWVRPPSLDPVALAAIIMARLTCRDRPTDRRPISDLLLPDVAMARVIGMTMMTTVAMGLAEIARTTIADRLPAVRSETFATTISLFKRLARAI